MALARNAKNGVPFRSALRILFKEILVGLNECERVGKS